MGHTGPDGVCENNPCTCVFVDASHPVCPAGACAGAGAAVATITAQKNKAAKTLAGTIPCS